MSLYLHSSFRLFLIFSLLFGGAYPLAVTLIDQTLFSVKSQGSLIKAGDGKILGSALIGQNFTDPKYFWGRLSATGPQSYNAANSSGSNLGSANPDLLKAVQGRIEALKKVDPGNNTPIPVDLVTASGSGLDPDISPAAAHYQAARVARARSMSEEVIEELIQKHTKGRQFGILGQPHVNVLMLNLDLDGKL
ncbi:MAG TPA: potassium-transporting ATPase subunit KdpC [Rickettsiales bacterium]|nr:potassium-transporting ATPase subunit KdpC [Rickettsiales bacterium]